MIEANQIVKVRPNIPLKVLFSQDCLLTGLDVCCEIKVFVNKLNCSYRTGFYVLEFEQK